MIGTPGTGFSNYDTLVRSSGLDRTLKTAAAFHAGAFPSRGAATGGEADARDTTLTAEGVILEVRRLLTDVPFIIARA